MKKNTFLDRVINKFSSKYVYKKELDDLLKDIKKISTETSWDLTSTKFENRKLSKQEIDDLDNEVTKWNNRRKRADALIKASAENKNSLPPKSIKEVINELKYANEQIKSIIDPRKEGTTDNVKKFDEKTLDNIKVYGKAFDKGIDSLERLLGMQKNQAQTTAKPSTIGNNDLRTPNYSNTSTKKTNEKRKGLKPLGR